MVKLLEIHKINSVFILVVPLCIDETACPEIPNFVIIIPGKVWEKLKQSTSSENALNRMYRLTIVKSARLSAVVLKVKNNFLEDQGKW
jgi:hypothetical protein